MILEQQGDTLYLHANSRVFLGEGSILASSVMWGDTSALLPENGYLVFIGEPGMAFELTFSEQ